MAIVDELNELNAQALRDIESAADTAALEEVRVAVLGKKGTLTGYLRGMGQLPKEERAEVGKTANIVRNAVESALANRKEALAKAELLAKMDAEAVDITLPGRGQQVGTRHLISGIIDEISDIFLGMGYSIADGPEVEYDYYNFQALNIPENHPARDTQDTFYITDKILLRSQTSPVQVRTMEKKKPPIRIISPGRVYRSDAVDATHSPLFHQLEGLVVDKGITMGDLKGTLELFAKKMFGEDTRIRFRPHHFPFTEPSAEVDVSCFVCGGKGCSLCKGEGWIEILGAGMVHPNVLRGCGIDPDVYSGFAFGLGIERIVMRKYNIDDMRLLYENDVRFLKQFN